MSKRNWLLGTGLAAAALTVAAYAAAGFKYGPTVSVDTVGRTAYGSLGSVQNTTDSTQYIACDVVQNGISSESLSGFCIAKNTAGTYIMCTMPSATLPSFLKILGAVTDDSFVRFSWDGNSTCTSIEVEASSWLYTKRPPP